MSELTPEAISQISAVDTSLAEADKFFKTLQALDYDEVTTKLPPIDRARYDLTILYAVNSLFWMLKRSYGEDPQSHAIKGEMDRIKTQMVRLKEVNDKAKMPRVDKQVAERVIRHELNLRKKSNKKSVQQENWENELKEGEEEQC